MFANCQAMLKKSIDRPNSSINPMAANKACTRLGVRAALSSLFFNLRLVLSNERYLIPPQAGNASRWAAVMEEKELLT